METITINSFFKSPSILCIFAPSGGGKTTLVKRIIQHKDCLFSDKISGVVFCYSNEQEIYKGINDVIWYNNYPSLEKIDEWVKYFEEKPFIIVLDDFMIEMSSDYLKETETLFTKHARHRNITIIWLSQHIFMKNSRTLSLNTQYFIALMAQRDKMQIATLGRQIFPGKVNQFLEIYEDSMLTSCRNDSPPYLLINCHPFHPDYRLITCIFPDDPETILYKFESRE